MYLSMPKAFGVPIYYVEEHILDLKIIGLLDERDSSGFTDKPLDREEIVIGVSLPNLARDRWVRAKKVMEEYAKEKGVTVKIENADYDEAKQVSQVESLISQGIDALAIAPINLLTAGEMVDKARKAGVKVISYDRLIQNSEPDLYVAFDNITIGQQQGKYLVEKVPKGNYIIIYGTTHPNFIEGSMDYIKPLADKGDIKIVAALNVKNWDPKVAHELVKEVLDTTQNKIDAILAPNDAVAGAVIEVLENKGADGKVVVTGQDGDLEAVRRIIERTQSMTIFKDTRMEGKTIIDTATKLVKGEDILPNGETYNGKINVPSIFLEPIVVDSDNVKRVIIDSGYYKPSEVYRWNSD